MALLTVQAISANGITPSYAAVSASDTYPNAKTTMLHVKNGGAGTLTITFTSTAGNPPPGTAAANKVITVNAGLESMIWLDRIGFNDSNERVTAGFSPTTSVTVGVFTTPG